MDPNETLHALRELAAMINDDNVLEHKKGEAGVQMAELFDALDGWLSAYGFVPEVWRQR